MSTVLEIVLPIVLPFVLPIICPFCCIVCRHYIRICCQCCQEEPSLPLQTFQQQPARLHNAPPIQTIRREQQLTPPRVYQNGLVSITACGIVEDHLKQSNTSIHDRSCSSSNSCSIEATSLRNSQQRAPPSDYRDSVVDMLSCCPICLENFQEIKRECGDASNNIICMIKMCKHTFHRSCILKWMESDNSTRMTCPICRMCCFIYTRLGSVYHHLVVRREESPPLHEVHPYAYEYEIVSATVNANIDDDVQQSYSGPPSDYRDEEVCCCAPLFMINDILFSRIKKRKKKVPVDDVLSECAICLEDLGPENADNNNDNKIFMVRKCKHTFHLNCIHQWLDSENSKTCPICRVDILQL